MRRIFLALLLAAAWLDVHAQSSLPPCPGGLNTTTWTNCFGTYTLANGDKYVGWFRDSERNGQGTYAFADGSKHVGEWSNGKRNGQGIEYAANGAIKLAGLWVNDALSEAYAIDPSRYPFSASSGVEAKDSPTRKPNKKTSVGVVNDCLAKGLKPGTSQFSKCVAGQ